MRNQTPTKMYQTSSSNRYKAVLEKEGEDQQHKAGPQTIQNPFQSI
jgi:hypothetical protein